MYGLDSYRLHLSYCFIAATQVMKCSIIALFRNKCANVNLLYVRILIINILSMPVYMAICILFCVCMMCISGNISCSYCCVQLN